MVNSDPFFNQVFLTLWFAITLAPPGALCVFFLMRRFLPSAITKVGGCCLSALAIFAVCRALALRFAFIPFNFDSVVVAYVAYCFLIIWFLKIPKKSVRIILIIAGSIPICLGYLLATVGVLALMFMIGDYTRLPTHTETMDGGLICEVTVWGAAMTDEGYEVHLRKNLLNAPFFQREVVTLNVDESRAEKTATCADALAAYVKQHR